MKLMLVVDSWRRLASMTSSSMSSVASSILSDEANSPAASALDRLTPSEIKSCNMENKLLEGQAKFKEDEVDVQKKDPYSSSHSISNNDNVSCMYASQSRRCFQSAPDNLDQKVAAQLSLTDAEHRLSLRDWSLPALGLADAMSLSQSGKTSLKHKKNDHMTKTETETGIRAGTCPQQHALDPMRKLLDYKMECQEKGFYDVSALTSCSNNKMPPAVQHERDKCCPLATASACTPPLINCTDKQIYNANRQLATAASNNSERRLVNSNEINAQLVKSRWNGYQNEEHTRADPHHYKQQLQHHQQMYPALSQCMTSQCMTLDCNLAQQPRDINSNAQQRVMMQAEQRYDTKLASEHDAKLDYSSYSIMNRTLDSPYPKYDYSYVSAEHSSHKTLTSVAQIPKNVPIPNGYNNIGSQQSYSLHQYHLLQQQNLQHHHQQHNQQQYCDHQINLNEINKTNGFDEYLALKQLEKKFQQPEGDGYLKQHQQLQLHGQLQQNHPFPFAENQYHSNCDMMYPSNLQHFQIAHQQLVRMPGVSQQQLVNHQTHVLHQPDQLAQKPSEVVLQPAQITHQTAEEAQQMSYISQPFYQSQETKTEKFNGLKSVNNSNSVDRFCVNSNKDNPGLFGWTQPECLMQLNNDLLTEDWLKDLNPMAKDLNYSTSDDFLDSLLGNVADPSNIIMNTCAGEDIMSNSQLSANVPFQQQNVSLTMANDASQRVISGAPSASSSYLDTTNMALSNMSSALQHLEFELRCL